MKKATVDGPTVGDCGAYDWTIQWSLENADKDTRGWIVQKVTAPYDIRNCWGIRKSKEKVRELTLGWNPDWYPFWEAWPVRHGQVYIQFPDGPGDQDNFKWTGTGDKTKGFKKTVATAEFYPNLKLPDSFVVRGVDPAGDLAFSQTDEHLTGGTGPVQHEITANWDCCRRSDNRKTTVSTV